MVHLQTVIMKPFLCQFDVTFRLTITCLPFQDHVTVSMTSLSVDVDLLDGPWPQFFSDFLVILLFSQPLNKICNQQILDNLLISLSFRDQSHLTALAHPLGTSCGWLKSWFGYSQARICSQITSVAENTLLFSFSIVQLPLSQRPVW